NILNIMITVTKKQASVALVITAFATIMIAGSIALNIPSVYACGHGCGGGCGGCGFGGGFDGCGGCGFGGGFGFVHHHTHQSIDQGCIQPARSSLLTSGFGSPVASSGNNVVSCVNANLAGNAASSDQGR
ncbi:MAG TPA: hypothetical protein VN704_01695, partial [Verrucomicrobiae bacterium]|nr:hypothetical protein [Verrucomicrobiae bacterium]